MGVESDCAGEMFPCHGETDSFIHSATLRKIMGVQHSAEQGNQEGLWVAVEGFGRPNLSKKLWTIVSGSSPRIARKVACRQASGNFCHLHFHLDPQALSICSSRAFSAVSVNWPVGEASPYSVLALRQTVSSVLSQIKGCLPRALLYWGKSTKASVTCRPEETLSESMYQLA